MSIYSRAFRDPRVREYLPSVRIVAESKAVNSVALTDNLERQTYFGSGHKPCVISRGGFLILDFGIELNGGVKIIVPAAAGGKIRLRFGESVSETMGCPNQDHSIHDTVLELPKLGALEYGCTGFRFVRIDAVESDITLLNVLAVALYRDLEYAGSFECSDARLNQIWKTGAYTVQLNLQDYIYDGIKRDRLVWLGDLNPEIRVMLSVFRDCSLIPESLDFVRNITPLPNMMNNISSYSLWWIINQYEYYLHTGDLKYLSLQTEYLKDMVKLFAGFIRPDGSENLPMQRFTDWPSSGDPAAIHAGLQGLMYWAMKDASALFGFLGCGESRRLADSTAEKLSKHVPDCGKNKSAAALLTVSGLSNRADVLTEDRFRGISTFYGYYMLLGQPSEGALELIRRYWGAMLDFGATTFWEDFDLDWTKNASRIDEPPVPGKSDLHADFGNYCYKHLRHSFCHGWAGGPTAWLSEKILGVRVLEPGFRKAAVRPQLCGLDWVRGTFPTPEGPVSVEMEKGSPAKITAPDGVKIVR